MQCIYTPLATHKAVSYHLESLTFAVDKLNEILGVVRPGDFIVLYGSRMCHNLSELLCVRNQPSYFHEESSPSIVFIDGGNLFDPYLISDSSRLFGLDPWQVLKSIWVSRAFTGYQMMSLVTERLHRILEERKVKMVVISDIPTLFCDSNIGVVEAKKLFNRLTCCLRKLVKKYKIILIVTTLTSRSLRKRSLEQYLLGRAGTIIKVVPKNSHIEVTVEKHPSMPITVTNLYFGKSRNQRVIDNFWEG
jgi:hypothetical protein